MRVCQRLNLRARDGRSGLADGVEANRYDPRAGRADGAGCAHGEVEAATAHIRPPVGDRHDDVASVAEVGDPHLGAEAPGAVGGGELALVEDTATRRPASLKPGPVVRGARGGG